MLTKRSEQRVRVFKNGRSHAIRIPREFDFGSDEVIVTRETDGTLTVKPVERRMSPRELVDWLRAQSPLSDDDLPRMDDDDMGPLDTVEL